MERAPTYVHAAPPAAAAADTATYMAPAPRPSTAQAADIKVSQRAAATCPETPANLALTHGKGGYRNSIPAPSWPHHATLTGLRLKSTVNLPASPCVSSWMCSDLNNPAERPGNMSDIRLISAPAHTSQDKLSPGALRTSTHTRESPQPHKPEAPAAREAPPHEGQPSPSPKSLLTEECLNPALGDATTEELPSHLYTPPPLASTPCSFSLLQEQDDRCLHLEARAGVRALLPPSSEDVGPPPIHTFDDLFDAHFGLWPEHLTALRLCIQHDIGAPLKQEMPPSGGGSSLTRELLSYNFIIRFWYQTQKKTLNLEHQRRGWGLPWPLAL